MAYIAFALFLIMGTYRKYLAIIGWSVTILNLWLLMTAVVFEINLLYPALALLALPFLAITARSLLDENPVAFRLTMSAAVATLIFVPVSLIPLLRDGLVSMVVTLVSGMVTALGYHPVLIAWDVLAENGFCNQIISLHGHPCHCGGHRDHCRCTARTRPAAGCSDRFPGRFTVCS